MSAEKLTTPTTTDDSLFPSINWYENSSLWLIFKGNFLIQKNATFTPPNMINFFIAYKLDRWSSDLNSDFTLKDSLFGGVKLKMQINTYILVMLLDSIRVQDFYYLTVV